MEMHHLNRQAYRAITQAKRLLAVCHRRPDGDALGSTAALLLFCRRQGISARAFCADPVPADFAFLPETERFTSDPAVFDEPWDVVAVLDCAGPDRIGVEGGMERLRAGFRSAPTVIAFDHHRTGRPYADISLIDPSVSSTAELVRAFFLDSGVRLDVALATALLTGVTGDTDSLTNPAATRPAFLMAADLLSAGADWRAMNRIFVRNRTVPSLHLLGLALDRLKFDSETGLASTVVFLADCPDGSGDGLDTGLANFLGNTLDAEVILVLKERDDGTVTGSFRTVLEADTAAVAQRLGGGGHRKASGFTVTGRIVERAHGWTVERAPAG